HIRETGRAHLKLLNPNITESVEIAIARTSLKYLSRQIEAEKSLKHLGTVSVSLDALSFPQKDISSELRYALIDEYTNEKKPDDSEFYYKIRELQGRFGTKNLYFEIQYTIRRLTREDVEAIQLSAPSASAEDAERLHGRIKGATKDYLTPSLFGFFENLKYLQGPSDCIKLIVRPRRRDTIQSALEEVFSEPLPPAVRYPVQTSNASFKIAHPNISDQFNIIYRQLWLFALREYRDMPKQSKRKLAGVKEGEVNSTVLFSFASLAEDFSFRTEQTQELQRRNPDQEITLRFLHTIRKPDQYNFENLNDSVAQVIHVISKAEPLPQHDIMELDVDNVAVALPTRCRVPNDLDQRRDKSSMFLHKLHKPITLQGTSLTSLFIQRSVYFSFFGKTINIDISNLQEFPESHP
ncbi:hypothetical protein BN1708_011637, partial [Verticillium longisporum]